jgi:hypothetical protein
VPIDSPRLDHLVYELILVHFLIHDSLWIFFVSRFLLNKFLDDVDSAEDDTGMVQEDLQYLSSHHCHPC